MRIRCYLSKDSSDIHKQYLISIPQNCETVGKFASFALNNYLNVSNIKETTVTLDGFEIIPTESIHILQSDDVIHIQCKCKKEEQSKKKKAKSEKKEKELKKCNKCNKYNKCNKCNKTNKHSECTIDKSIDTQEETNNKVTIIDNTKNENSNAEWSIPTNKIIRFGEDAQSDNESSPVLRIRQPNSVSYKNTNTPTVNAPDKKKRKTRRGKRAGKHCQNKETEVQTNVSFLDYIANEPPTITANNSLCVTTTESKPSVTETAPISVIQQPEQEDSITVAESSYQPHIEDRIQFHQLALNKQTLCPEIQTVKGRIINIVDSTVHIYVEDEDTMVEKQVNELADAIVVPATH